MKENFPNLVKAIDFQEVQRVSKILDPRKHIPRHIIIKLPKIKDKERILKAARGKESFQAKKEMERSMRSQERQGPVSKSTLSSKAII